ncbi:hypothetical protein P5673_027094 [Acropora cervicornis]|uniref:Uncharacterized protein n=1 Tax=Acropora cervicornis TaxID=6130 RepID=A0AAD9UW18_ACRCE|nr:hypothetical protein P5673_027094 [Acropora cervicornis]
MASSVPSVLVLGFGTTFVRISTHGLMKLVILEIGTNDLTCLRPEVTGSKIEELLRLLLDTFSVRVIAVCEVLHRARAPFFNDAALILNQYPFLMSFVGVIGVLTTQQFTLICLMGFM